MTRDFISSSSITQEVLPTLSLRHYSYNLLHIHIVYMRNGMLSSGIHVHVIVLCIKVVI